MLAGGSVCRLAESDLFSDVGPLREWDEMVRWYTFEDKLTSGDAEFSVYILID